MTDGPRKILIIDDGDGASRRLLQALAAATIGVSRAEPDPPPELKDAIQYGTEATPQGVRREARLQKLRARRRGRALRNGETE